MLRAIPIALAVSAAFAQPRPEFEVASVKTAPEPDQRQAMMIRARESFQNAMPAMIPMKGRTVSVEQTSLLQLVAMAYKVRPSEVAGPSWISEVRFNIEAKLPEGADTKQASEMLKNLLEERFGLRAHDETKAVSGYTLTVAKDGPKLTPAAERPPISTDPEERKKAMQQMQEETRKRMEANMRSGMPLRSWWNSSNATSAQIATAISNMVKAPVDDQTGLPGKYDVSIEVPQPESKDDPIDPLVAQAVAKLGLKLTARKIDVKTIVVNAASKTPAEN